MQRTPEQKIAKTLLGRKKPVTREQLADIAGLSDRDVRTAIERLRNKGLPVMSDPNVAGYWLAGSQEELEAFKYTTKKKCRREMRTAAAMKLEGIEIMKEALNG